MTFVAHSSKVFKCFQKHELSFVLVLITGKIIVVYYHIRGDTNITCLAQFKSVQIFSKTRTKSSSFTYYRENTRIMYHTESTEAGIKLQKLTGGISVHILFSSEYKISQEKS